MSGQPATTPDMLVAQIEANRQRAAEETLKLSQSLSAIRQDNAEAFQEISATLTGLQRAVSTIQTGNTPGPVNPAEVAQALCDPASRKEATQAFGLPWLLETKEKKLWPTSALEDDEFMTYLLPLCLLHPYLLQLPGCWPLQINQPLLTRQHLTCCLLTR